MTSALTSGLSPRRGGWRTSGGMLLPTLVLLMSTSTPEVAARAQAPHVLSTDVKGFGGPLLGVAQAGDGVVMVAGGRGGLLLDERWLVGGALSGTPLFLGTGAVRAGAEKLAFWQGGVLVQRQFGEDWVVRPRVGAVVGAAWLRLESAEAVREGLAFSAEPTVGAEVQLTRFLQVGLDLGYRFVAPVPSGLRFTQVSGVTGSLTLHFGWF